jgi:hypothetical protein
MDAQGEDSQIDDVAGSANGPEAYELEPVVGLAHAMPDARMQLERHRSRRGGGGSRTVEAGSRGQLDRGSCLFRHPAGMYTRLVSHE